MEGCEGKQVELQQRLCAVGHQRATKGRLDRTVTFTNVYIFPTTNNHAVINLASDTGYWLPAFGCIYLTPGSKRFNSAFLEIVCLGFGLARKGASVP